jgi:hypothetical protein
VEDNILAFWGISDDFISNDVTRNIIRTGRRVERLDLYARLKIDIEKMKKEYGKLISRLEKSGLSYNKFAYEKLQKLMDTDTEVDYNSIVYAVDNLVEV